MFTESVITAPKEEMYAQNFVLSVTLYQTDKF